MDSPRRGDTQTVEVGTGVRCSSLPPSPPPILATPCQTRQTLRDYIYTLPDSRDAPKHQPHYRLAQGRTRIFAARLEPKRVLAQLGILPAEAFALRREIRKYLKPLVAASYSLTPPSTWRKLPTSGAGQPFVSVAGT